PSASRVRPARRPLHDDHAHGPQNANSTSIASQNTDASVNASHSSTTDSGAVTRTTLHTARPGEGFSMHTPVPASFPRRSQTTNVNHITTRKHVRPATGHRTEASGRPANADASTPANAHNPTRDRGGAELTVTDDISLRPLPAP